MKISWLSGRTPNPRFPFINKPKPNTPGRENRHPRTDSSKCCCVRVITWFPRQAVGVRRHALLLNPTLVESKDECSDKSASLDPKSASGIIVVDDYDHR